MSGKGKGLRLPAGMDHRCLDHRARKAFGDDCLVEVCTQCGRTRYESDGVRPMAWFVDPSNPSGHRYAYPDPRNEGPSVWKFAPVG